MGAEKLLMTSFEFIVLKWVQNTCKWNSFQMWDRRVRTPEMTWLGSNRGLRDFWTDQVISTDILMKTHYANTYYINMRSYLNTLHRIWVICVYRGYMWDKYVLWAAVNDMAALYGGSHDRRNNITPNYGCDIIIIIISSSSSSSK